MKHGILGVAFDLDGTLYPNYRMHIKILPHLIKDFKLVKAFGKARGIIRKEQEKNTLPKNDFYQYQAEITAKILNVPVQQLKDKIERDIYRAWEPPFKNIKLFKGVKETLAALKEAGYKLGLLSDFPVETKLELLGLQNLWDVSMSSEDCGAIKPHPLSFEILARKMGLEPEKILYVGNSREYDVNGAACAGMKTAWIKPLLFLGSGFKKPLPDFSFTNYRQLLKYMLN